MTIFYRKKWEFSKLLNVLIVLLRTKLNNLCTVTQYQNYNFWSVVTPAKFRLGNAWVGVIVNNRIAKGILNFIPVNDRMVLLEIEATPVNMILIQIYEPATVSDDYKVENFYGE